MIGQGDHAAIFVSDVLVDPAPVVLEVLPYDFSGEAGWGRTPPFLAG